MSLTFRIELSEHGEHGEQGDRGEPDEHGKTMPWPWLQDVYRKARGSA